MNRRSRQFRAQALGEPDLRELRRRIRAHERDAALAGDRRDDDDVAAALTPEHRDCRASRVVGAEVVDVEKPLHLFGRDLIDRSRDTEAGVAHHHVESAEALHGAGDQPLHVGLARHVGDNGHRLAPGSRDRRHHLGEPVAAPRAEDEASAVACEPKGRRASDAGGCAGDGDDGAFDVHRAEHSTREKDAGGTRFRRRCKL